MRAGWPPSAALVLHPGLQLADLPLPLTTREREILTLLAQGLANKAIADALTMSVRTVEGHIYRASTKLGVTNRTDLATLITDHHRARSS